jgi:threonine synthase
METTPAFDGLRCTGCGASYGPATTGRCPDCDGTLDPVYDFDAIDVDRGTLRSDRSAGVAAYASLLPFPADRLVTAGEAATPLLPCPGLADDLGVAELYVKDEGTSATGAVVDRGVALAVTAARERGATDVALASTGNGGQAAAAYAARAGLAAHAFVPSRTPFVNKAMVNVHGGDMSVVGGRYADADAAFADAREDGWYSLAPFETPYRHEGAKTLAYELAAQRGWTGPDAVVHPTGHGTVIAGLQKGFDELRRLGLLAADGRDDGAPVDTGPRLYAAQASGCAPIASAWADGTETVDPVATPDTICGPLEIPDPAGGQRVLDALAATGGAAAAAEDADILENAISLAEAGVTTGSSGGAALAVARVLVDRGELGADDTVVLLNPTTGNKEADILRSHLMSKGV